MMFVYVVTASASAIAAAERIDTSPAVNDAVSPFSAASALPGSRDAAAIPAPATAPVRRNVARLVRFTSFATFSSSSIEMLLLERPVWVDCREPFAGWGEAVRAVDARRARVETRGMRYEIKGDTTPILEVQLAPGDEVVAESGELAWMHGPVELKTGKNIGQ